MPDPNLDFDPPIDERSPAAAHDAWESFTNMDADDLERLRDSERYEEHLERAEGIETDDPPLPGGPVDDAITLAETPADEWTADHRAEAAEARNFFARTLPQFDQNEGEALTPEESPRVHKGEIALMRWAYDPAPDDDFP